jgi:hypothetical protein
MQLTRNILVGAFVLGGVILFGVGLFLIGNQTQLFSHSVDIYTDLTKGHDELTQEGRKQLDQAMSNFTQDLLNALMVEAYSDHGSGATSIVCPKNAQHWFAITSCSGSS